MKYTILAYVPLIFCILVLINGYFNTERFESPKLYSSEISSIFSPKIESQAGSVFQKQSNLMASKMKDLFNKSRKGDSDAMYQLGQLYSSVCMHKSLVKNIPSQNTSEVFDHLTSKNCDDEREIQNKRLGMKMIKIAAELGNPNAQVTTANKHIYAANLYLKNGSNFISEVKSERHLQEAIYWLEKASKNQSSEAWYYLSSVYGNSAYKKTYNIKLSEYYFKKAVDAGHENAVRIMCEHFELYDSIDGIEKPSKKMCEDSNQKQYLH